MTCSAERTQTGGKYPHLCVMGGHLRAVCDDLKVLHINRPLEDSIRSLQMRSRRVKRCYRISDCEAEKVQRWLWQQKQLFLNNINHLSVQYYDLLSEPQKQIERITRYLNLTPNDEQRKTAAAHVEPKRRKH